VDLIIAVEDPNDHDVRALLQRHLSFARGESPPEHVHALGTEAWSDPGLTLYGARLDGVLTGVGAIRQLDETHGELKAMHTRAQDRGQGVGQAMLTHLLRSAPPAPCTVRRGSSRARRSALTRSTRIASA
jgi:putative acetyltransferase